MSFQKAAVVTKGDVSGNEIVALTTQLLQDIKDSVRVLRTRDGVEISDLQVEERAKNIVAYLLAAYDIKPR